MLSVLSKDEHDDEADFQDEASDDLTKESRTGYTALSWPKLNWFLTFFTGTV